MVARGILLALLAAAVASCRTTRPHASAEPGEVRGMFLTGFETQHFHPCGTPADSIVRVAADSAAHAVLHTHRDRARVIRLGALEYTVYHVRWVLRDVPLPSRLDRPGVITNRPRQAVVRVIEVEAPVTGECESGELWSGNRSPAP